MMTEKSFLEQLTDTLDTEEELGMEMTLEDLEDWDSLSLVSFIAMANASYGKRITAEQISKAVTVSDLYDLVK